MRSLLTHRGKIAVVTAQYSYKVRRILEKLAGQEIEATIDLRPPWVKS